MKKNLSRFDRIFRLAVAIELVVLFFYGVISHVIGDTLLVVAVLFAITSLWGYSPTYKLFNISTLSKKQDDQRGQLQ